MLIACLMCKVNTEMYCYSSCDNCKKGVCEACYELFKNELQIIYKKNKEMCQCKSDCNCFENAYGYTKINKGTTMIQLYEVNDSILCEKCANDINVLTGLYLTKWDKIKLPFI